jgi:hypothetical protein
MPRSKSLLVESVINSDITSIQDINIVAGNDAKSEPKRKLEVNPTLRRCYNVGYKVQRYKE